MTDGGQDTRRPITDRITDLNDDVRDNANYGEAMISGDVGFHTFFVPEHTDYGIGTTTALHEAFERTTEELWLDADIVEDNQGEVTPEAVADEAEQQLEDLIGQFRFFETFADHLEDVIREYQEKTGETGAMDR